MHSERRCPLGTVVSSLVKSTKKQRIRNQKPVLRELKVMRTWKAVGNSKVAAAVKTRVMTTERINEEKQTGIMVETDSQFGILADCGSYLH